MSHEEQLAEKLLQIDAVKFRPEEPFTWASGWKSPVYCDNRKVLSHPQIRDYVKSELCNLVFTRFPGAELIAGVSTAGIAWGALTADQLKLPFVYVRPKPKEHGMGNQIEGEAKAGQRAVVVEDLVSTGKSSLQVVHALRHAGIVVEGMVSLFHYGFPEARLAFEKDQVQLHALTTYSALMQTAIRAGMLPEGLEGVLLKWRDNPSGWTGID